MSPRNRFRSIALCAALGSALGVVWAEDSKPSSGAGKSLRSAPALEWLEYGEALERAKRENKHVLIDFYTSWCGWCKVMDRNTYADSAVGAFLGQHFLISKINAESPKRFKVAEGTQSGQELAREFGVNSFPITWFVKPDGSRLDKVSGYVPPDRFMKVLQFVHERSYDKTGR